MNRWVRWLAVSAILAAGLIVFSPRSAEATWGHCGCSGAAVTPAGSYYGGYYAPTGAYSPVAAPAQAYGFYTPYTAYYYGYQPYGRSFYYGTGMYWFGSYGW